MIKRNDALLDLCHCFRGEVQAELEWTSIIGLANRTLTTPALVACAKQCPGTIPRDVDVYLKEIFQRNLARNERLWFQLNEAIAALNTQGIVPVLIKGSALLAERGDACPQRIISDLDILVSPDETHRALKCLFDLGYRIHHIMPHRAARWHADLHRPEDVGMVDLQQDPPGHAFFYRTSGDLKRHCHLNINDKISAYIPDPTFQALMLIMHDQFQDSDYWTGHIDLRHLLDLRDLATSPGGIDWQRLASLAPSRLARNALETQLVALHAWLGVDVPAEMRRRLIPKLQQWRRRVQSHVPALRIAFLPMMLLDFRNYRAEIGAEERAKNQLKPKKWFFPKTSSIRYFYGLAKKNPVGKI
jgi:hypothetical protein